MIFFSICTYAEKCFKDFNIEVTCRIYLNIQAHRRLVWVGYGHSPIKKTPFWGRGVIWSEPGQPFGVFQITLIFLFSD